MRETKYPGTATVLLIFLSSAFLLFALLWNTARAGTASPGTADEVRQAGSGNGNDAAKILSVLESRRLDKMILDKVEDKMSDMNERNLALMSSLCDRITENSGTPAADLAYSLLTTLIVLS